MAPRDRGSDARGLIDRRGHDRGGHDRRSPDGPRPTTRRLFVGVPLPDEAAREVRELVESVRAMPLPGGARDVRWVRLDGLHLTLRFLGQTDPDRVAPTSAAIEAVAGAAAGPIEIEFDRAGTFPSGRRPRTLWIGVAKGVDALRELAAHTDVALVDAGWEPEGRPFRPHLTVARSDGIGAGALVAERLAAAMAGRRIRSTVDRVGLFESLTGGGPARYVPIELYHLGSAPVDTDRVYHQGAPEPSGRSPGST